MVNGRKIRDLREAEQLSVKEFGEKVNTSHTTICHIELGVKQPSIELLQRIAEYFNCSLDELVIKPKKNDTA